MSDNNAVELDVGDAEEVEVEVKESPRDGEDSSDDSEDQFSKAETSTQKRISHPQTTDV